MQVIYGPFYWLPIPTAPAAICIKGGVGIIPLVTLGLSGFAIAPCCPTRVTVLVVTIFDDAHRSAAVPAMALA